jgi:large subunit ribosomal protein L20
MTRVKSSVASRKRRKKLLKRAKGFVGDRKNHIRQTKNIVMRALAFNYKHRKNKKSDFRKLWIIRINVASRINGISYSKLMAGLKKANCEIDRKMLADLAVNDPSAFAEVANVAKKAVAA